MPNDVTTPIGQVRFLINDTNTDDPVLSDPEVAVCLRLEADHVKRAAALAYETIAADEALTSKYIRTQDLQTDGPKTAAALLSIADRWRKQADQADDDADEGFFAIVPMNGQSGPELTGHQPLLGCWP